MQPSSPKKVQIKGWGPVSHIPISSAAIYYSILPLEKQLFSLNVVLATSQFPPLYFTVIQDAETSFPPTTFTAL